MIWGALRGLFTFDITGFKFQEREMEERGRKDVGK